MWNSTAEGLVYAECDQSLALTTVTNEAMKKETQDESHFCQLLQVIIQGI
jgi:hypothetical protein